METVKTMEIAEAIARLDMEIVNTTQAMKRLGDGDLNTRMRQRSLATHLDEMRGYRLMLEERLEAAGENSARIHHHRMELDAEYRHDRS